MGPSFLGGKRHECGIVSCPECRLRRKTSRGRMKICSENLWEQLNDPAINGVYRLE